MFTEGQFGLMPMAMMLVESGDAVTNHPVTGDRLVGAVVIGYRSIIACALTSSPHYVFEATYMTECGDRLRRVRSAPDATWESAL